MICELVNHGKKVGITAVGHKVIRKLLDEVLLAARKMKSMGSVVHTRPRGMGPSVGLFGRSGRMTRPCKTYRVAP
jgi:hypothetical protein